VVEHLAAVARLLGSDRAAAVWIDEYGPGLVHAHAVVDLLSDTPRRRFAAEPLRMAWNDGVPGKLDVPDVDRSGPIPIHDAGRSLCAVALGSDGTKAWFLVADGLNTRLPLDRETSGQLMFIAGECAGVLLHRDLPAGTRGRPRQRFAGWPVLRDIEGHEDDEATNRRIGGRFLVARQLRAVYDDDFAVDPAAFAQQLDAVGRELTRIPQDDPERPLWDEVLRGLDAADWGLLAEATLALAGHVESQEHLHGARELYALANGIAAAAGAPTAAMESARLLARLLRRKGEWDEAVRWYEGARAAARVEGDRTTEAVVLDGWASTVVDKGNLPGARALLHEGLTAANESGSHWAIASIHHTLMRVERLSGRLPQAVAHGWRAVTLFPQEEKRYFALVSLAACFVEMRELDAAEDSYTIVLERVDRPDFRFAAFEMLAHVSALRGDRAEFEKRLARVESAGWRERASTPVHAQILQHHGLSWKALGDREAARAWLTRARDYAQEHGVNQIYFECDQAISELENAGATPVSAPFGATEATPSDPVLAAADLAEIRVGVGALRRELASV
jgi:tetratricopeptide (TPR) repeat protein